jgi:hypothetical protein
MLKCWLGKSKHFAAILVFMPACEPIPLASHGFNNLFFIERFYNLTHYTCGLLAMRLLSVLVALLARVLCIAALFTFTGASRVCSSKISRGVFFPVVLGDRLVWWSKSSRVYHGTSKQQ